MKRTGKAQGTTDNSPQNSALAPLVVLVISLSGFLSGASALWGWVYTIPGASSSVDLPEGWVLLQETESKYTFSDPGETCFLHVKRYSADTAERAYDLFLEIRSQLSAEGDGAPFRYCGVDACLADLCFRAGETPFRGYVLFISAPEADLVLMAITPLSSYNACHDFLLSALDSFARVPEGLLAPGPVSQFFRGDGTGRKTFTLRFSGKSASVDVDPADLEVSHIFIEREARVLYAYSDAGSLRFEAWRRYYRLIFRDSYARLSPVYDTVARALSLEGQAPYETARILLDWIQGFSYNRTGTLSDLESPLSVGLNGTGDCDARGLLNLILLRYAGIEGILMVSERYSHAVAAADIPGSGARFLYNGRNYLVIELTDDVAPGLIAADRADPAGWMGIDLERRK